MRNKSNGQPDNRILYHYIRLAYESTKDLSKERMDGNAEKFLADLYLSRLSSVFGEPEQARADLGNDIGRLRDCLAGMLDRRGADVLKGRIGDFPLDRIDSEQMRSEYDDHDGLGGLPNDQQIEGLGVEAYATYLPIHFFPEDAWSEAKWGIYISEDGVDSLAGLLQRAYRNAYGPPSPDAKASFRQVAFEVLLRHEMAHFRIESFALNAEMYRREAVYVPYLEQVYRETYKTDNCLGEAWAKSTVLHSRVVKKLIHELYPSKPADWWCVIACHFFDHQPPGYTNYNLSLGWTEAEKKNDARDSRKSSARRNAMNFLCNQIVTGSIRPQKEIIPFFAFLPDNYFLRAESLVPIYIVSTLDQDRSFINLQTPTWKEWERFLKFIEFERTAKGNGDHTVWQRYGFNRLTIDYHGKHLNERSFKSSLRTLGITPKEFFVFLKTETIPETLAAKLREYEPMLLTN
jgi:hypothetical protein